MGTAVAVLSVGYNGTYRNSLLLRLVIKESQPLARTHRDFPYPEAEFAWVGGTCRECDKLCITAFASLGATGAQRVQEMKMWSCVYVMKSHGDLGFERSALCNITHASFVP